MGGLFVLGEIVCFRIAKSRIQAADNLAEMGAVVSFDVRIALGHGYKTLVEVYAVNSGALVKLGRRIVAFRNHGRNARSSLR